MIRVLLALITCTSCASAPTLYDADTSLIKPLPYMTEEWTQALLDQVKTELPSLKKAKDISQYCPKFDSLSDDGKTLAWGYLLNAIIFRESGVKDGLFKTCSSMKESTGQDSIGLFQLSYGDSFCPKKESEGDLCDVDVNIKCALKLISSFVSKDQVVASGGYVKYGASAPKGLSRYWSVIRLPDRKSAHHLKEIMEKTAQAPGCK